ncbi:DUF177 domain-containing protein [Jannaschia sp. Os4]|uniref:YceD family protein n=1 Tax=Jannaschia sp. Os4 TaxID=2807617 RepID=UPI00193A8F72|nr:DUF177 domain-containing protein [Jannaschia sp. Os4]MBM2577705.1 DUF177 domain-containing protein [Jannaschia sp. Os4]
MPDALRHPIRLADLRGDATDVSLILDAPQAAALADRLGVDALRKVRLEGRLGPSEGGWTLSARLGATVVQPCGVTLEPVTTRVEEPVAIRYLRDLPEESRGEGEGEEGVEVPEEDIEPLADVIDLGAVLEEALALAVPAFPRAAGADAVEMRAAPPGAAPLDDEAVKPFAGLAALKAKMEDGG